MNAISQMFEKLLNDQMSIINQKIKGSGFLEILKFKILENLPKKADEIISNNKIDLLNNYQYEDNQKMIIAEMLYYDSPKIILNTKTDKNLLIICLNGNIKIDGQYINGDKSGLWTEYFRKGGRMRVFYANEVGKNGSIREWYKNGGKKMLGEYSQGKKNGLWISWYSNGLKESVVTYYQGEQQGIFSYFYDNGNKKSEGTVSYTGKKEQRCWDIDGNTQNCIKGG